MPFPSSLDAFVGYIATETLQAANNAAQLNQMQNAIVATESKIGTGASTPTNGSALVGNGAGTSTWGQVSLNTGVTGVLQANAGGTGVASLGTGVSNFLQTPTSANLAAVLPDETGTGSAVFANNPVLNQPTINYSNNSISSGVLGNNSVSFANLLSTIFSGQVTSYVNAGTAGGTFYYINLGGIKLLWGITSAVATGTSYGITMPAGFFNTIQAAMLTAGVAAGTAAAYGSIASQSTTTMVFNFVASTGSGTMPMQALVIGT
jgi:hypothetical protein